MNRYLRRLDPRRWLLARRLSQSAQRQEIMERYHRFLAVQHYIRDESDQLQRALAQLDVTQIDDRELLLKSKFMPQILQANIHLSQGDSADAVKIYRQIIAKADKVYQEIKAQRFRLREHRRLEFLSIVRALLYCNLAKAIAKTEPDSPSVIEAFEKSIQLQPNLVMLRENLGWHYVDQSRWQQAEAAFLDAYACTPTNENDERLHANLAQLRHLHATELKQQGNRAEAIAVLKSGVSELSKTELHGWTGKLQFDLGEAYREESGKLEEAGEAYEQSAKLYLRSKDNSSASYVIEVLATFYAESGETEKALHKLEESLQLAPEPQQSQSTDRAKYPRLLAKQGLLNLQLRRTEEAAALLDKAWTYLRQEGWFEPYGKMVDECQDLLQRNETNLRLKLYLQQQLRLTKETPLRRDIIGALRRCWSGSEKQLTSADSPSGTSSSLMMLPVVTPLALEIDSRILDEMGGDQQIIEVLAPDMRQRLHERYGVKVPGIRLRANETDLPYGFYVLMIHEVPLKGGTIKSQHALFLGPPERLDELGISSDDFAPGLLEEQGFWVAQNESKRIPQTEGRLLTPAEIPIQDLENLIAANLIEFVGHQEVQNLLESHGLVGPDSGDIVSLESCDHMDPLTNVVRALVSERVPLTDFPRIHAIFLQHWREQAAPWRITEAIRRDPEIRPKLWGNDPSFTHLKLGERFMALIEDGIRSVDETVLALEPETTQELLNAVREAVQDQTMPALIVPRQNRRSVIRSTLELEFPLIPVLAMSELEPGLGNRIQATIEPEPDTSEESP